MTDRELMEQALEALTASGLSAHATKKAREAAIAALHARLAQPEQEPAAWAWYVDSGAGYASCGTDFTKTNIPFARHIPLYTAPPQRKPLTDDEIALISVECAASHQHDDIQFARAVIAKATGEKE